MSENNSILLERSEQLRWHLSGLLDALQRQPPAPANVAVDPMQSLMQGPGKDSFFGIVKLVTFSLVQKLVPYMPKEAVDPALLGLERARITLQGDSATVFHLKPGRLTATWINEKGQFKVDDLQFKLSWWWLLLNFNTASALRRKFTVSLANASQPVNG
jgi:hypothetical protein